MLRRHKDEVVVIPGNLKMDLVTDGTKKLQFENTN
jgi:hypothetical protein